jgi:hypothetical protein
MRVIFLARSLVAWTRWQSGSAGNCHTERHYQMIRRALVIVSLSIGSLVALSVE